MDVAGGILIQARYGKAAHVRRGQHVKAINPFGSQVLDTWAFNSGDVGRSGAYPPRRAVRDRLKRPEVSAMAHVSQRQY
jgi:uncharacterized protein YcgI (DUF1989 family)